ncbi:MAG: PIN domain-containing protein [Cytophagales bacterium]|nr:PIN domain-containing protein [Cytophagales bacterium]
MDKVLIDTSIILDLFGAREPHVTDAQAIFSMADEQRISLYVSPIAMTHAYYYLSDQLSPDECRKVMVRFRNLVNVLPIDQRIMDLSLTSVFQDVTDAVQYFSASEGELDLILTRNLKDFRDSHLLVLTPKQYLGLQRSDYKSA